MYFHANRVWTDIAAVFFVAAMSFSIAAASREGCGSRMQNCTERVHPYLHDLEYMFPTNLQHIDNMCRMWSSFVDCIRLFVKDCATEEQRSKFNNAVGDSIDTVHAICSSEKYQKEYLQSASCFRKVSVDNCGSYYNDMIDEVGRSATNPSNSICCSYSKFRSCVSEPLLRLCGSRARTIMDHSMTFLIHRCSGNSYSLSYNCPKARGRSAFIDDRQVVVSSSAVGNLPDLGTGRILADGVDLVRARGSSFNLHQDGQRRPYLGGVDKALGGRFDFYNGPNTFKYDDPGSTQYYRSSPTIAAPSTYKASSSAGSFHDPRVRDEASARSHNLPAESTSSRLLRNFNDNDASSAWLASGRESRLVLLFAAAILVVRDLRG